MKFDWKRKVFLGASGVVLLASVGAMWLADFYAGAGRLPTTGDTVMWVAPNDAGGYEWRGPYTVVDKPELDHVILDVDGEEITVPLTSAVHLEQYETQRNVTR